MNIPTAQRLITLITATLADANGTKPSGHVYGAIMGECTHAEFNQIVAVGIDGGLWAEDRWELTLTDAGQRLAADIRRILTEVA